MAKGKKASTRHRLLVYYRLGQRWRTIPLLIMILGALLYALGWLAQAQILQAGNIDFLAMLWEKRILILGLIAFSLVLYLLLIGIAQMSAVEVRPKALRVRGGLVTLDISYGRISAIRLVQLSVQHPVQTLSRGEEALLGPFLEKSCTAVDMLSWPKQPVKKLWHKFMFTADQNVLLLIVENPMELNQQIDTAIDRRRHRIEQRGVYQDPIERAVQQQRRLGGGKKK